MLPGHILRIVGPALAALTVVAPAVGATTLSFCPGAPPPFSCAGGPVGPDTDVVVPIRIDPAAGVDRMDLVFQYDPSVLTPVDAFRTATTDAYTLTSDLGTPGIVTLSLTDGPFLTTPGSEEVAEVLFHVTGGPGSFSDLTWIEAIVNDGAIESITQDQTLTVGLADSVLSLPDDVQAVSGQPSTVPLSASDATGAEGIDLIVRFNPTVVVATGVTKTPLTQAMSLTVNLNVPGEVRISLFIAQPLVGSGPLVDISFDTVGAVGEATPLNVARGVINEGGISTVLDDGLLLVSCAGVDADGDGVTDCAGDCDDADMDVFPGAVELCDGKDNNCDGAIDNLPAPDGTAFLLLESQAGSTVLSWSVVPDADGYDVVRGDLGLLVGTDGDFTTATQDCLIDDLPTNALPDPDVPPTQTAFWYVVRAVNCGVPGTYDSTGTAQQSGRDAGVDGSPFACP